jgi:hypothetical protein
MVNSCPTLSLLAYGLAILAPGCPSPDPVPDPSWNPFPGNRLLPYTDVTSDLGVDYEAPRPPAGHGLIHTEDLTNGGGAGLLDLTGDGVLDLLLTAPYGPNALFLGDGDGFVRVDAPAFENLPLTTCVSAADLDGDGLRDLFLCTDSRVVMYRNLGDGAFEDVGDLLSESPERRAESVAIADYDGDGFVDLYVGIQGRHVVGALPVHGRDRVFEGRGGFTFEETTAQFGDPEDRGGLTFGATWLDIDRDGALDLLAVKDRGAELIPATLFVQPSEPEEGWSEAATAWNLDFHVDGMGIAVGDVQGDGSVELAVGDNFGRMHLRTVGAETSEDVGGAWGLINQDTALHETSWGMELADLDNDGDLDLAAAFGRREYGVHQASMQNNIWEWHASAERFRERTDLLDFAPTNELEAWRGVLPGDLDGDGTLELVFTSHVGPVSIQRTEPTFHHWLAIAVRGPTTNPDALGAEVVLRSEGREFVQWIGAGTTGLHSVREPAAHFGLGPGTPGVEVTVRWPDGHEALFTDLEVDRRHLLER